MSDWHPPWTAQVGLRLIGLGLIAALWPEGRALSALVRAQPDVTGGQLLLGALCFLSASAGAALLLLGPDIWKPVRLSNRWTSYRDRDGDRGS